MWEVRRMWSWNGPGDSPPENRRCFGLRNNNESRGRMPALGARFRHLSLLSAQSVSNFGQLCALPSTSHSPSRTARFRSPNLYNTPVSSVLSRKDDAFNLSPKGEAVDRQLFWPTRRAQHQTLVPGIQRMSWSGGTDVVLLTGRLRNRRESRANVRLPRAPNDRAGRDCGNKRTQRSYVLRIYSGQFIVSSCTYSTHYEYSMAPPSTCEPLALRGAH